MYRKEKEKKGIKKKIREREREEMDRGGRKK
jgi:hypothetical protein